MNGDLEQLVAVLEPDVAGGVDLRPNPVVRGARAVTPNLVRYWGVGEATLVSLPFVGHPCVLAFVDGEVAGIIWMSEHDGRMSDIDVVVRPEVLALVRTAMRAACESPVTSANPGPSSEWMPSLRGRTSPETHSPKEATVTLEGTHQTSKATLPAPGQYRLMPELTTVRFAAKKFGLFTIRGTMALTTGTAAVTAPPESSTLHATLAANSFRTPMARRDEHVKGPKLIDSASFPTIDFDSTRVEPTAGGWTIHGLLTVHGISEPIALDVRSALRDGELLRARATARIDRRDFGVTKFRFAAASRIDIDMDVAAEPVHR